MNTSKTLLTLIIGLITILFSCQSNTKTDNTKSEIKSNLSKLDLDQLKTKQPFSLLFSITNTSVTDSTLEFTGKAIYNEQEVGLTIDFKRNTPIKDIDPHDQHSQDTLIANAITFKSIGEETNILISNISQKIDSLYDFNNSFQQISASAYSIIGKVEHIDQLQSFENTIYKPNHNNVYEPLIKIIINRDKGEMTLNEINPSNRAKILSLFNNGN